MASKAFAHRPGAFAPTARTQQAQQSAFIQPQPAQPVYQPQPQPAPQVQPAPQAIPGFAAQAAQPLGPVPEFGTEAYYQYQHQAQAAGYHLNQGAANEQEAYRQRQAYMDSLKAQYDQDNDCAKFNMTTEEAQANKKQLDQMIDILNSDDAMMSAKPMLDTIDKFRWMISQVVTSMRKPELWIPEMYVSNPKYVEGYRVAGQALADAIEKYSSKLTLMQNKPQQQQPQPQAQQPAQ